MRKRREISKLKVCLEVKIKCQETGCLSPDVLARWLREGNVKEESMNQRTFTSLENAQMPFQDYCVPLGLPLCVAELLHFSPIPSHIMVYFPQSHRK